VAGSPAVNVAIGLVFTYFLFAMLCSGVNELIARQLNLRGKMLFATIVGMLGSDKANEFWNHSFVKPLLSVHNQKPPRGPAPASVSPLMTGEAKKTPAPRDAPSYVSPATFSRTVAALFTTIDDECKATLQPATEVTKARAATGAAVPAVEASVHHLLAEACGDIEKFRVGVEQWFNDWMDRLSGVYKRYAKRILLLLAIIVTLAFNVNSLLIARTLWRDPTTRNALVQAAQQTTATTSSGTRTPPALQDVYRQIGEEQRIGVPIGWSKAKSPFGQDASTWLWFIAGWALTVGALSFGAPFWFDMLTRLNSLRSSGPPPGSATAAAPVTSQA
jgi:hypothetical protein